MEPETSPLPHRKGHVPRLIAVPVILVAFVALLSVATRPLTGGEPQPSFYIIGSALPGMQIGQIAPGSAQAPASALALTNLDGAPVALADSAGRPIWIIFWKTACPPCEEEAADVAAAYAGHQADRLVVLGIDAWDTAEAIRDYAKSHPLSFPIAIDRTGGFMEAYGVWGAPTHYFIDSGGIIQERYFGPMTRDLIEESLNKII